MMTLGTKRAISAGLALAAGAVCAANAAVLYPVAEFYPTVSGWICAALMCLVAAIYGRKLAY